MQFSINGRPLGPEHPPYIIAELSANHNGSLERALQSIDAAKASGADAVKIQTYSPDTMTLDSNREDFMIRGGLWDGWRLYDLYKWAQTPYEWHRPLFDHAARLGLTIFSTPFDETAVDLLESLHTPAYKVASFEATDLPLIDYLASTGKPVILSTGMCSETEIAEAVDRARAAGCRELALLHCISSYPTPIDQANLRQIPALAKRFGLLTGLSDHTLGTTASVAAVALGAAIIEKHFTLSRADKGPDCDFSLEPPELAHLCRETKDAWSALGQGNFERQPAEQASKAHRRSLYFAKAIKAGEIITPEHIRRVRPGLGLPPKDYPRVLGRRVNMDVAFGTPLGWQQIEDDEQPPEPHPGDGFA